MKTKIILLTAALVATLGLFSFKTLSGDNNTSKTILISALNGKGENEGFMITYGDGKIEKRPFTTKIKGLDTKTWIQVQSQAAIYFKRNEGKRISLCWLTKNYDRNNGARKRLIVILQKYFEYRA